VLIIPEGVLLIPRKFGLHKRKLSEREDVGFLALEENELCKGDFKDNGCTQGSGLHI
jgi:hypothetical protein